MASIIFSAKDIFEQEFGREVRGYSRSEAVSYTHLKWRELYPEEKLAEIRELARVGNQSKTRYVWTIHPFMNNRIRFGNEAHYQEDLATIKAKFTQLMKVGVREFGILADDEMCIRDSHR